MFKRIILSVSILSLVLPAVLHAQDPAPMPVKLDSQPSVSDALVAEPVGAVEPIGDAVPRSQLASESVLAEPALPSAVAESIHWLEAADPSVAPMPIASVMIANPSPEIVFSPNPTEISEGQQTLFLADCQICREPVVCCRNRKKRCCFFRGVLFRGRR